MERKDVEKSLALIDESNHIVITCHRSPDGDAIGSSLGLWHFIKSRGKKATVVVPDGYPDFLKWMEGNDEIVVYEGHEEEVEAIFAKTDLVFCLDYNDLSRTGPLQEVLEASQAPKIMIDHHQDPAAFAAVMFSDTLSCSTAQMVYQFIELADALDVITPALGECIYCGIMTDTGSFRFPSVTEYTHRVAAYLISIGVDHSRIHQRVHDANSPDRMRLVGYAISEKMELFEDCHAGLISLSQAELERFNYKSGDTESLVNQVLSIAGVHFAIFARDAGDKVKMSFRSQGSFKVNEFANKHFGGGGHLNAAGGASSAPFDEVVSQLRSLIQEYKSELNY